MVEKIKLRVQKMRNRLLLRSDMHNCSFIPWYIIDNPQQIHYDKQVKHSEGQ